MFEDLAGKAVTPSDIMGMASRLTLQLLLVMVISNCIVRCEVVMLTYFDPDDNTPPEPEPDAMDSMYFRNLLFQRLNISVCTDVTSKCYSELF